MVMHPLQIKKAFSYQERLSIFNLLNDVIQKAVKNNNAKIRKIENDLVNYIVGEWNKIATKAINKVLSVNDLGAKSKPYTNKDLDRTMFILDSRFKDFDKKVDKRVKKDMEKIYVLNLDSFSSKVKSQKVVKVKLDKTDKGIIDDVTRLENIAIGDHYPKNLKPSVSKIIKESVVDKGLNKAQAGEFLKNNLTKKLGGNLAVPPSVKAQGQKAINAYFKNLSATNVTMAQNYGQLNYMHQAGIKSYIWRSVIDKVTSTICLQMNGRVFEVSQAMTHMNKILESDSVESLKEIAPFKRNLSEFKLRQGQKLNDAKVSESLIKAGVSMPPIHLSCYDSVTEVYTEKGFVMFSDVNVGDKCLSLNPETKNLEWVESINVIKKHHKGEMLYLTNNQHSLDLLVTPDHKMFYYKRVDNGKKGRSLKYYFEDIKQFQESGSEVKLYLSSNWKGEDVEMMVIDDLYIDMNDFCEFMGYYLADGSLRQGYPVIAQTDNQKYIFDRVSKMGFKNVTMTKGKINIYDKRLGLYCEQFGKCNLKFVPNAIKKLSSNYLKIFLDSFIFCDGHIAKPSQYKDGNFEGCRIYFTTSKTLADDIGEILIKIGKSCSYTLRKVKGNIQEFRNGNYIINYDIWDIREINSKYRHPNIQKWVKNYDGYVYDISLPKHHTLLVRRNGRVCWGSNCRSIIEPYF